MQRMEFEAPTMRRLAAVIVGSMFWCVSLAGAQEPTAAPLFPNSPPVLVLPPSLAAASAGQTAGQPSWLVERRACEGCPPRSVGKAFFQTTVVNVFYGIANLVR